MVTKFSEEIKIVRTKSSVYVNSVLDVADKKDPRLLQQSQSF
ncbi:hypothetical protein [Streptococcus equi]|nr:hypothetical protein [Streptococcus equi]